MKNKRINDFLLQNGWSGSCNKSKELLKSTRLMELLPNSVIEFFVNFPELTTETLKIETIEDITSKKNIDYYFALKEKGLDDVDKILGQENPEYYYSILLGVPIYTIGLFERNGVLFLDKYSNFYIQTELNAFYWIGNSTEMAFKYLFFGEGTALVLNEDALLWVQSKIAPTDFMPPINKKLLVNPF